MSRLMKDTEVGSFEERYGYKPTLIAVAIDALAVFVHKDNPIEGLTLQQVDAIFSSTRACGAPEDITTWGQLGLGGEWATRSIQLYGRNSVSGTYGYFKQHVLCNGDFRNTVNEQPGSASVVQSVSSSVNGIGYSGIGYTTSSVRGLPLATRAGKPFVAPTPENTLNGSYPLSRFLYIYINKVPGQAIDPLTAEFLKMVLSRQGQEVVVKDGYVPLPARVAEREREKIVTAEPDAAAD
jgi:phosphate transport system substrate-binding protein